MLQNCVCVLLIIFYTKNKKTKLQEALMGPKTLIPNTPLTPVNSTPTPGDRPALTF